MSNSRLKTTPQKLFSRITAWLWGYFMKTKKQKMWEKDVLSVHEMEGEILRLPVAKI